MQKVKEWAVLIGIGALFVGFCVAMFFLKSYRWGNCP